MVDVDGDGFVTHEELRSFLEKHSQMSTVSVKRY